MNLFYAEELNESEGRLGPEESHHAHRVLRMQPGDPLLVTQGKGVIYTARLLDISKKLASFEVTGVQQKEDKLRHTHIAIAPTKSNDRFETFIEKASELGVDEITPLICEHSERKLYKTERGNKIIQAASKQSLSCWWPVLNEPVKFSEFLKSHGQPGAAKFIAYCGEGKKKEILQELPSYDRIVMLIGPEGDFSEKEVEKALKEKFLMVSLGHKRLRTETAGIAVALVRALL